MKYYDIIEEIKKKKNELKKLLNTQLRYDQTSINFENSYDISILSKHKEQIEKLYFQRYIYLYLPKNYTSYSIIQKHSYIRKELTAYMLDLLENDNYDLLDKVKIFKIEFMKWSEPKYIEASAPIDNNNNDINNNNSSCSYEDRDLRVDRGSDVVNTSIIGSTCNNINHSDVENNNIGVIHPTVADNHHHRSSVHSNHNNHSNHHNNHHRMGDNHYNNGSVCRVYNNNDNDRAFNSTSTSTAYDHHYLTHATTTTAIAYIVNDDGHHIEEEAVGLLDHSLIDRKRQLV